MHVGPNTVMGIVKDVSQHGMGLVLPSEIEVKVEDTVWLLVDDIASYAITATVRRVGDDGFVGIEFEEILQGDALVTVEKLPLTKTLDITE